MWGLRRKVLQSCGIPTARFLEEITQCSLCRGDLGVRVDSNRPGRPEQGRRARAGHPGLGVSSCTGSWITEPGLLRAHDLFFTCYVF